MLLRTRKAFLNTATLLSLVILFQLASSVQAMCVYNQTDISVDVRFTCGTLCENNWTLSPGEHKCRTDKAGTVWTQWVKFIVRYAPMGLEVDRHGYLVFTLVGVTDIATDTLQVCSYDQDDSLEYCSSFDAKYARKS